MKQELLQKIEMAKSPDFGQVLSKSFDLYKIIWLESLLHALATLILAIPLLLLFYMPFITNFIEAAQQQIDSDIYSPNFDYPTPIIIVYVFLILVVLIATQMFSITITAHFFKVCKIKDLTSEENDEGYFYYFKGRNFVKTAKLSLVTFGIAIVSAILCYLPILYVMVPLQLMIVIFAFNEHLSVSDIISLSFKLGNKFWLLVFGLTIVSSMIAQLGIIFCLVGVLFTVYFIHIPIYFFYKKTIGFDGGK